MGRLLALVCALIAGALIAWVTQRTPPVAPATAPPGVFSADRAMPDVARIARRPHPVGSAANLEVRDFLMSRMTALGLEPQVRRGTAFTDNAQPDRLAIFGGEVENLVGVLAGRDRTRPAVALMAHYDSVPGSPGAADDAAGVAAALEAVRALKARGQPERDVMVVLTDGEEAGLLGAAAFFRRDPLAKRIGLVINMEARGGGGRAQMFETSPDSGALIGLMRRAGERPSTGSLTQFVYRLTPNDTDFTLAREAGVQGLNYAFIGRQFDYHAPTSTPDRLEAGTLQDLGQQVLAVAGEAAFAPALPAPAPDLIYSQVFADLVIAYPLWVGWAILAGIAGLILAAALRARRVEPIAAWDVIRGAVAVLAMAMTGAVVLYAARKITGVGIGYLEQRPLLAQAGAWEAAVMVTAVGVLLTAAGELARGRGRFALLPAATGVATQAFGGLDLTGLALGGTATVLALSSYGWPSSRSAAWLGVLLSGLALGALVTAVAPAASYALVWPLALGAAAAALTGLNARPGVTALAVIAVIAAISLGWIGGMAHLMFLALDLPGMLALPMLMAALVIWPLAQPTEGAPPERLTGPILLAAGMAAVIVLRFADPYDAEHPRATQVTFHLDQGAGLAWRVSRMAERDPWIDAVLSADGGEIAARPHWVLGSRAVAAPAAYLDQPAPEISVTRLADGRRRIEVRAPPGARTLTLRLRPDHDAQLDTIADVAANYRIAADRWTRLHWEASNPVVDLVIQPSAPGAVRIEYAAGLEAWPKGAKPLPPRSPALMAFDTSDSTLVTGSLRLAW